MMWQAVLHQQSFWSHIARPAPAGVSPLSTWHVMARLCERDRALS